MFGNFSKLNSPRRLVQFWQNLQTSLVLLIPNCTRQRMITYTYTILLLYYYTIIITIIIILFIIILLYYYIILLLYYL